MQSALAAAERWRLGYAEIGNRRRQLPTGTAKGVRQLHHLDCDIMGRSGVVRADGSIQPGRVPEQGQQDVLDLEDQPPALAAQQRSIAQELDCIAEPMFAAE